MRGYWCLLTGLAVFLFCVSDAWGQVYPFTGYTTSTGLPSNTVWSLTQDPKGNLWIGTDSGLCRYDGVGYSTFGAQDGLEGSNIGAVTADRQGNIWVVTNAGLSRSEGKRFQSVIGLTAKTVHSVLAGRDGSIWLGTSSDLVCLAGNKVTTFGREQGIPPFPVWALLEDRQGRIWIGSRGGGLLKYEGGHFTRYGKKEGWPDETIFNLVEDPKGGLWAATNGGLVYFDGTGVRTYTTADGLSSNLISGILVDQFERVWVCTYGAGLNRIESGRCVTFTRKNGLPDEYLTGIVQDYEGNLWCATRSHGIFRFQSEIFGGYTAAQGVGEGRITGIGETPDHTVWFSSLSDGLIALGPQGGIRKIGLKDGLPDESLWGLQVDRQSRVWVCGNRGVSVLDGKQVKTFSLEEIGAREQVTSIALDRQGRLWFGSFPITSTGVLLYDGKTFLRFTTQDGLSQNSANSIAVDLSGTVWVCTETGLNRFADGRFTVLRMKDGLPSNRVQCAFGDIDGALWVGTDAGLARYHAGTFQTYTTAQGLLSNVIRWITRCDGKLWVGTSRGVSLFDGVSFTGFTTKDGLVSDDLSPNAVWSGSDRSLWFGTNAGVVRYQNRLQWLRQVPPRLEITGVRLADRLLEPVGAEPLPPLPYAQNNLAFEFLARSLRDETAVRYSFWLDGFEKNWSPPQAERSVRFTNLPAGTYRFRVKSLTGGGRWSEPVTLAITIQPPFWQRWWFVLGVAAGTGLLGYGLLSWRIRSIQLRQAAKEEERVAHLRELQEQRIEHLRQLQEARLSSLRELLESIRVINSRLDLSGVLQNIAEESARLIEGEPGGIGLLKDGQLVFDRLWKADHWEEANLMFQLGEGVAGTVAATGKALIVNDPEHSQTVAFHHSIKEYFVHGMMDVPILSRTGQVCGVLDVRRPPQRPPFTESDRQLIESLANQAAVAIENAALYGEVGEKNLELEEKNLMIAESLRELTRLYEQEQQVTRTLQELNQMKTNFLMVTSHEMRTPLTVLKGYNEALLEEALGPLTKSQKQSLAACQRMLERLAISFADILEMLRINEGQIELRQSRFDLCHTIQDVVQELSFFLEKRNLKLTTDTPDLLEMEGDEEKIRLILINLVQNAIKFTPDDGEIHVGLQVEPESVLIRVRDTGIGIEASELGRVFEKFYTGRDALHHKSGRFEFSARGTGLGLAITKSYTEAHGGTIRAESDGPGQGTCMVVELPLRVRSETTVPVVAGKPEEVR
ncbi:MAG: GAF domain-containing protein [Blastocatellia bacterium]|nr:GAF domain-containing protein [Blastocatellia bacterium]